MKKKKIDILILSVLGCLIGGLILATLLPTRNLIIPTYSRNFYIHLYLLSLLLGGINILIGLGLLYRVRDDTIKKLGTITWLLEIVVAGFVFVSIFFIRLDWGILPFYAGIRLPSLSLRILPATVIFIVGTFFIFQRENKQFAIRELLIMIGLSFLFNLAVVAVNPSFVANINRTFNRKSLEYYGDVSLVDHDFMFHYADKMPQLSLHGKTHPPLPTLFLWVLTQMGLGIFGASVVTVLFGSLTLIFVYKIAYDLFGEEAARVGVGIFWLVPSIVIYSAVSMDVMYMFLCAATVFYFLRTLHNIRYAPLGALCFSLALFSTFTAGFLLLVFAIWIGLAHYQESLPNKAYKNIALAGGLILLIHLALWWNLNYNVFEVFFRAKYLNSLLMDSGPNARPYSYWVAGNLIDYFTFLGFPVFSLVCLYGWDIKKKWLHPISHLWRFFLPSLFLTSPA